MDISELPVSIQPIDIRDIFHDVSVSSVTLEIRLVLEVVQELVRMRESEVTGVIRELLPTLLGTKRVN